MNRKETILVSIILLATFTGGAFATPSITQVLVTNFPNNQQVTVTNLPKNQNVTVTNLSSSTLKTTSVDIQVLNFAGVGVQGVDTYTTPTEGVDVGNLTAAFSFTPNSGFQQVTSVTATILYHAGTFFGTCNPCSGGDRLNIVLNGQLVSDTPTSVSSIPQLNAFTVSNIRSGLNLISLFVTNPAASGPGVYYVYQLRLTVEYTYFG